MSNFLRKMEQRYGSRKPGEAGNGGAERHAGGAVASTPTTPEAVAAAVAKSFAKPGEGFGLTYAALKRFVGESAAHYEETPIASLAKKGEEEDDPWVSITPWPMLTFSAPPPPAAASIARSWHSIRWVSGGRTIYGTAGGWDEADEPAPTSRCGDCGAYHKTAESHACGQPEQIDLDAVRTVQSLAASGLSAEEIAFDMNLRLGWRHWGITQHGLSGSGMGANARWRPDAPLLAMCANHECAASKTKLCEGSERPTCRIHASKTREMVDEGVSYGNWMWQAGTTMVIGRVAMWGDVIECEQGWLASRAYPIALPKIWARMYRVTELEQPESP